MQLFVKGDSTLTVDVSAGDTPFDLKEKIQELAGIDVWQQRLIVEGEELDDEISLDDCNIEDATVYLVHRLAGGAKKRKKKNYTTPKKIKHKKKKVKIAVLKYYKVDENGKIHRLRRECPGPTCGAGIFMASMEDRHYCGKCGATYVYNNP